MWYVCQAFIFPFKNLLPDKKNKINKSDCIQCKQGRTIVKVNLCNIWKIKKEKMKKEKTDEKNSEKFRKIQNLWEKNPYTSLKYCRLSPCMLTSKSLGFPDKKKKMFRKLP